MSSISAARSRGAMPAVGSSIRSSFGSARQRDRQLDALDVAIGERRARPVGQSGHADRREELYRLLAMTAARVRARRRAVSPAWLISAIWTFSATVIDGKVWATWKVRPTPRRNFSRGVRPRHVLAVEDDRAGDPAEAARRSG